MAKPTLRQVNLECPLDQNKLYAIDGPEAPVVLGLTCPHCGWVTGYDINAECYNPSPPLVPTVELASESPAVLAPKS